MRTGIGEAKAEFLLLKSKCNSEQLSDNIKVRGFNTNVKMVVLYGVETWRNTTIIIPKAHVFVNKCLLKKLTVSWLDSISESQLWKRAQ